MTLTLSDLVPEQMPEVVAEGFQFTEGPVWHPEGYLLFSDIPADTISDTPPASARTLIAHPAATPMG